MEESRSPALSLRLLVAALLVCTLLGTVVFSHLEDWTYISAAYFTVTTYVDRCPRSNRDGGE